MLEAEDRLRVEKVVFAFAAPLVLASDLEGSVRPLLGTLRERRSVALGNFIGKDIEAHTAQSADHSP